MSESLTPQAANAESDSLSVLASRINEQHLQATRHATSALEHARQAGELLQQAKQQVGHGGWIAWLTNNCNVSPRQAQRYLKVANNWTAIAKNDAASYLTIDDAASSIGNLIGLLDEATEIQRLAAVELLQVKAEVGAILNSVDGQFRLLLIEAAQPPDSDEKLAYLTGALRKHIEKLTEAQR